MSPAPANITVLHGGSSPEREISLVSGRAVAAALEGRTPATLIDWNGETLPASLDPKRTIIFPALHGGTGEDGHLQELLELAGFAYVGSDAHASSLCMDKQLTKITVARAGVPVAPGIAWHRRDPLDAAAVRAQLGTDLIVKPRFGGSSIGLSLVDSVEALAALAQSLPDDDYLIEERIRGRELSIGVLDGEPLVVVEIVPKSGLYDYASKYTSGSSQYLFPAPLSAAVTERVRALAQASFEACGCRDVARIDFLLRGDEPVFLEVNTLPGMTPTSLLPKSAAAHLGLDFPALVQRLLQPALRRFAARHSLP